MRTRPALHALGVLVLAAITVSPAAPQPGERIVADGSTGVMPLVAALAKAFQERHSGIAVEIGKGLGTKARIEALAAGTIDIALASHGLVAADLTRRGMAVHEIAKVPVVFGVNASVPVTSVTDRQVCDIYAGTITNWRELGGPDAAIAARTRPDSEVDAEVVRDKVACLKGLVIPAAVKVMPRSGDMARELAATAGSLGMTTATVVEQSGGRIRALMLNGVAPSADNVERGAYALTRDSFLVTGATPSPAVARFVAFVRSPAGAAIIRENGAVPVQ